MGMRRAGAVCVFLVAAHQGWSQYRSIDQQLRMWNDFSIQLTSPDALERRQVFGHATTDDTYPSGDRVSVAQLQHKVPGKAVSAFTRGLKFAASGDYLRGAKEFERAATIDPKYPDAHGNLGVMYINLGLSDMAAAEFRRAIELEPASSFHHANLALALIFLNLAKEAEAEAQTAVDLDHSNAKARYLLGVLLARHPQSHGKAAEHLTFAALKMPEAHLILAQMYREEGSETLAQMEQDKYRKATLELLRAP
jgi:tetratricopeptide (TPR) repeat protein